MIRRNTWILLAIMVVLFSLIYLVPYVESRSPKASATPTFTPKNVFGSGNIIAFKIVNTTGQTVSVKSTGTDTWSVTEPNNLVFNTDTVKAGADALRQTQIQTELLSQPPVEAMGLTAPQDTLTIQMSNGSQNILKIGNKTAAGDGYYVQLNAQPAYIVSFSALMPVLDLLNAGQPPATPTSLSGTSDFTAATHAPIDATAKP